MIPDRNSLTVRSSGRGYEREVIVREPERGVGNGAARTAEPTIRSDVKPMENPVVPPPNQFAVDREKTCPLLLRVFCNVGRHFSLTEFAHGNTPTGELQIYTWLDASLKELTALIRDVHPEARRRGTYFEFSLVFPEIRSAAFRIRSIGTTCNGQKGLDDNKQLADVNFHIGDFMSVAITPPERPF